MSILVTGDLHRSNDLNRLSRLLEEASQKDIKQNISHLICLGDWGVIWNDEPEWVAEETRLLAIYEGFPWETLVVLGNHEGYERISRLPWSRTVTSWGLTGGLMKFPLKKIIRGGYIPLNPIRGLSITSLPIPVPKRVLSDSVNLIRFSRRKRGTQLVKFCLRRRLLGQIPLPF